MTSELRGALSTIAGALTDLPPLGDTLAAYFRGSEAAAKGLPGGLRRAADDLAAELPALSAGGVEAVSAAADELLAGANGDVVMRWCLASAWRLDAAVAPLLEVASRRSELAARVKEAAAERVVGGPIWDALQCAPLMGVDRLADGTQARARLEILIWEAGAGALEVPAFGQWLWSSPEVYELLVGRPGYGALRGRVLAARCLEMSVCAVTRTTNRDLVDRTLKVLQPLLLHPEPLVWMHAARALGRLTGPLEELQGMVLDWVMGDSPVLRQRAITAFASLPADRLGLLASQLIAIVTSPSEEPLVLAAVAAATPYLYFERPDIWNKMAKRILAGDGGAVTARAFARGLATLWRRGGYEQQLLPHLRALRTRSHRVESSNLAEMRRWLELGAVTDCIDGAERDPLDLELGLDNLMRVAAHYDDPEADARAARFARALAPTFQEALRLVLAPGGLRLRAAAVNAVEACARVFALRLWSPLLATSPGGTPVEEPDLEETWEIVASTPAVILDQIKERRAAGGDWDADVPLEALALRLGGYALDACGEDTSLGPGSGRTAHDICLWLRKLQGLTDGSRDLPPAIESALSALFWRLVDTTRGSTLGEADDVAWLGPFAAWWALVIDRPAVLERLATALPMLSSDALKLCCGQAQALREGLSAKQPNGAWGPGAGVAFRALQAMNTELAHALGGLSKALAIFANAAGPQADLESRCMELVLSGDRLQAALSDPVKALHPPLKGNEDSLGRANLENAPRRAALMARATRARDISLLEVWLASLGPVASSMIEAAVLGAIERTPVPPPQKPKDELKVIEGYELIKNIGEGGIGSVWLVRKPGADRMFVLKIPKAEALSKANETEARGILRSFVEEAAALAGLYHPNVANIIDRGVSNGVPFLVLEYLIGADLKYYSEAKLMSLFELRQVVIETCAGLEALHSAGLVHRDIKPANIWLRLPLGGGQRFDPSKHRDPAVVPPLASVIIDFGMVRAAQVSNDVAGRFVAGTAGYIAPEQVLDPVYLHPRADLYSLAGTIYKVTTGRTFFDEITNDRERIMAHMHNDPFEDASRLKAYPKKIATLMRAAATKKPEDRPAPLEFAREFASSL